MPHFSGERIGGKHLVTAERLKPAAGPLTFTHVGRDPQMSRFIEPKPIGTGVRTGSVERLNHGVVAASFVARTKERAPSKARGAMIPALLRPTHLEWPNAFDARGLAAARSFSVLRALFVSVK